MTPSKYELSSVPEGDVIVLFFKSVSMTETLQEILFSWFKLSVAIAVISCQPESMLVSGPICVPFGAEIVISVI